MVKFLKHEQLYTISKDLFEEEVIIYGTSYGAIMIYKKLVFQGVKVIGFTDSYATEAGKTFLGKPVIPLHSLKETAPDASIVVGTKVRQYMCQITETLNNMGIDKVYAYGILYSAGDYDTDLMKQLIESNMDKINYVYQNLADEESRRVYNNLLSYRKTNQVQLLKDSYETRHKQYFPEEHENILHLSEDEVFVDAGGYDGNTVLDFITRVDGKYKKVYTFEPEEIMFSIIKEIVNVKKLRDVSVQPYGVYDKTSTISFKSIPDTGSSRIGDEGTNTINTVSLDELLYDHENITFLKMDIEGVEREALEGAKNLIARDQPKLAISIYHKPDDLWEIPYLIKQSYPDYKLYIRHYTDITTETICYGVPEGK